MVRMPASFPATIEVRPRRTLGEMLAFGAVRCLRDIQACLAAHPEHGRVARPEDAGDCELGLSLGEALQPKARFAKGTLRATAARRRAQQGGKARDVLRVSK